ncbi:hypothetical protein [Persephonella sp. KM09-Lau-8]|uniref:hypothetical protein n=1 Tax=Persephonella sp. KM09-Lau-8 TaxID=1158345 RepID=UPI000496F88E|nr:hypothetical protein [Persephonella sp. KM09-Lau-8]
MNILREYKLSEEEIEQLLKEKEEFYMLEYFENLGKKKLDHIINLIKENPWIIESFWINSPKYKRKLLLLIPEKSVKETEKSISWICEYSRYKKTSPILAYGFKNTFVLSYLNLQIEGGRKFVFQKRLVKKLPSKKIKTLYYLRKYETIGNTPDRFKKDIEDLPVYFNPFYEHSAFLFEDTTRAHGFLKSINGKIPFKKELPKDISKEEKRELERIFSKTGKEYLKYKALYKEEISGNQALVKSLYINEFFIPIAIFLSVVGFLFVFLYGEAFFYTVLAAVSTIFSINALYSLLKEKIYQKFPKPFIAFPMWKIKFKGKKLPFDYIKREGIECIYTYIKTKEKYPKLEEIYIQKEIEKIHAEC